MVLLNAPLYFNGCESQQLKFTVGTVVPCGEFADKLLWWSWPNLVAGLALTLLAIWGFTRRVRWMNSVAASNWFVGTLVTVATIFNSWLAWPPLWANLVLAPQMQIAGLLVQSFGAQDGANEMAVKIAWLVSGRLYYATCVVGVYGAMAGVARCFAARTSSFAIRPAADCTAGRWQIQLGGLIIAMIVLGTAIGMSVRLLMQQSQ